MQPTRFIVHEYSKFSNHVIGDRYDFNCIGMKLSAMQEQFTGIKRFNWAHGNKVQLMRLINGGDISIYSREQMFSIADEAHYVPTFYVVSISEIGAMFDSDWVHWLPENTVRFLKETGVPILLSQPGEFGFEWVDVTGGEQNKVSQLVLNFDHKLAREGLTNPVIIHNMSKIYSDLNLHKRSFESVYSRQWIEHVRRPEHLSRGTLTYKDHLDNVRNKKIFFSSNRAPRESRCVFLLSLIKNNNLDKGFLSFLCEAPANVKVDQDQLHNYFTSIKVFSKTDSPLLEEYLNLTDQALNMLPIELDEDEDLKKEHVLINRSLNHYRLNSLFEVVTETHDFTKEIVNAGVLSEKVFWPIANQMPFIVLGHRCNTMLLEELGFKTFDDDFKVASDPKSNIFDRCEYINQVILKFDSLTEQERFDWLNSDVIKEKIIHNYNHLINTDWNKDEVAALVTAFNKLMHKN